MSAPRGPSRPSDAPPPHRRPVNGRGRNRRPHVLPLVFGLIDARIGGVDYLDTIGWEELMRLLRGREAVRHGRMHRSDAYGLKTARADEAGSARVVMVMHRSAWTCFVLSADAVGIGDRYSRTLGELTGTVMVMLNQ